jgi:hypothetical protein
MTLMNKKTLSLVALSLVTLIAPAAEADAVVRKVIRSDELPYGSPTKLTPTQVHLPNGAREGGAVPDAWTKFPDHAYIDARSLCVEGRTSFVAGYETEITTDKFVTIEGKEYLDRAAISTKDGKIAVKEASRTPVMRLLDAGPNVAVWGFRHRDEGEGGARIVLLTAVDYGENGHGGIFLGCRLNEASAKLPTQSVTIRSSPAATNRILGEIWENLDQKKGKRRFWSGEEFRVEVTTSKSAADPVPMIALFLKR